MGRTRAGVPVRSDHPLVTPVLAPSAGPSRTRLVCRICGYQGTVTAGTVFEKTRTPLTGWFAAVLYITSHKHGVSALGMHGVTNRFRPMETTYNAGCFRKDCFNVPA